MRTRISLALIAAFALAAPAFAGFTPYRDPNCASESESDCTRMLPHLPKLPGWHADVDAGHLLGASLIVPDGFNYDQAKVVIKVRATAKLDLPESITSVADLMRRDREDAERDYPGTVFADEPDLKSGDGKILKSQSSVPAPDGERRYWDRYAYVMQGEYYLTFNIYAADKADLDANMKDFERLVAAFKAKL